MVVQVVSKEVRGNNNTVASGSWAHEFIFGLHVTNHEVH